MNVLGEIGGVIILLFSLAACHKEELQLMPETNPALNETEVQNVNNTLLGKQLENPYTVENMRKAYANLTQSKSVKSGIEILATHYYVRYLPATEQEWNLLKKDTTLELFNYPLDYEIPEGGTSYHDPSLPENAITWQYCAVEADYEFEPVEYEILEELYIPELLENTGKYGKISKEFTDKLVNEALRITGNLDENSSTKASSWTPKGTIRVWDDVIGSTTTATRIFDHWEYYDCTELGGDLEEHGIVLPQEECKRAVYRYEYETTDGQLIPLDGVKVRARRWFTTKVDYTDTLGYFETGTFKLDVNYSIIWETSQYDIRNGDLLQAYFNGPKKTGEWTLDILSGESLRYATIHRAAFKHFYGDNLGIRRPNLATSKTKICYIDKEGTGVFWGDWSYLGVMPDIKIWGKSPLTGDYNPTNQIFGTTAHELGHQSHSLYMGMVQYWQISKVVYESWADAVEWALTNDEYHKMGAKYGGDAAINYNHEFGHSFWPLVGDDASLPYSPIFIDLMDSINQRVNWGADVPNDLIDGYTLSFIHSNILSNSYGLSSLRNEINNNRITGVSENDVNELFALYWDINFNLK